MYYEDFQPGREIDAGSRMITGSDLDSFLALSGLENPIFMNDSGAGAAGHPGRLVPAPFQLSVAMGLAQKAGIFDHVVVVLEFQQIKFLQLVRPGQVLRLKTSVSSKRTTSKPDRGIVVLDYEMENQEGQKVMTARAVYMMRRKTDGD